MRELLEQLGVLGEDKFDADGAQFKRKLSLLMAKRPVHASESVFRLSVDMYQLKAAAIIETSSGPNDLFVRAGNETFLIVYPLLPRRESRLKAAKLHRTVEGELLDAAVDLQELTLDAEGSVKSVRCPDLDTLVSEMIAESEAAAENQVDIGRPFAINEDGPARHELVGVDFIHRPMLTLHTKIVSTFSVVPVCQSGSNHFKSGYDVLSNPGNPHELLDLDQLTLRHTIAELNQLITAGGRSLFVVPVHFETLANPRRAREYSHFGLEKLAGLEKRIVFEIVGLPNKVPQARLVELVGVLAPTSRSVIARFPSDTFEFMDHRSAGLHAVGIDVYGSAKRERTLLADMERFADMARKGRLKSYVQGVRTLSMLTAAISAGFDYVSGHALGKPCLHAEDIRTFQIGEMYRLNNTAPAVTAALSAA